MPKKQNRMKILPLPQISQLTSVLRPIVSVRRGRVLGFGGALLSSRTLNDEKPKLLIRAGGARGWRVNLEHACVKHACVAFSEYCDAFEDSLLFVNVDAQVVASHTEYFDELAAIIEAEGIPAERVVLELSEAAVEEVKPLVSFCERARSQGFLIALDDVGTAHANFETPGGSANSFKVGYLSHCRT